MPAFIRNIAVASLILAFLLPAAGYVAGYWRGAADVSVGENRALAGLPRYDGILRDYTAAFDDHLEDRFGLRQPMIRLARKIRDNLGENPPQVVFGKDGWLFLGEFAYRDEFEGHGRWDAAQVDRWIGSLRRLRAELGARDIPFAAAIAYDKARLYPDYLPEDWTESPRRFRTEIHDHPDAKAVGLTDVAPSLYAAKAKGVRVFYKRDTHWTPGGTHPVAMQLLDALDPQGVRPRYRPSPPNLQAVTRRLDLDKMAGFETSQEPPVDMIDFPELEPDFRQYAHLDADGMPLRKELATLRLQGVDGAPEGRLVIVGDSFADTLLPHLLVSYSEIMRIHFGAGVYDVTLDEILSYEPDAVLFLVAERQAARKARPFANVPLD